MNINFKTLAALCALSFAVTGCANSSADNSGGASSPLLSGTDNVEQQNPASPSGGAVEVSEPTNADCTVEFSADKINVSGSGAAVKDNVVTISKAGAYSLSGSSDNARILVDVGKQDEVTLMLDGVSLKSADGGVIDCEGGKTLVLYLNDNTENFLSDSADYTFAADETEPDGAVFSRADLVIMGGGSLSVTGSYKEALKCKDGLTIKSGKLDITAADDGIVGKDYVLISGGDITINAQSDGIKSTNDTDAGRGYITITDGNIDITAGRDGIQSEKELTVEGGRLTIFAGGEEANAEVAASSDPFDRDRRGFDRGGNTGTVSESKKGLKAGADVTISGGEINITSADDSVHSNANVTVTGGTLILSSCDDGIHADETLAISDGAVSVTKSYEGLEGKNIEISGGEIDVRAADDGLNAAGGDNAVYFGFDEGGDYFISISGGNITVNADGDGIDSNGTIAQSGGYVVVYGPTNSANGAIDYERSYAVSGGTLIALGAAGMAQAPGTLSQPCLSINANVNAGSAIEVRGSDGRAVLSTETPKQCSSLIFTSDKLVVGEEYGIYADGELLSALTAAEGVTGNGANGSGFGGGFGGGRGEFGGMGRPDDGGFGGVKPNRGFGGDIGNM